MQVLVRVWEPPPQVTLQFDHLVHSVKLPPIARKVRTRVLIIACVRVSLIALYIYHGSFLVHSLRYQPSS